MAKMRLTNQEYTSAYISISNLKLTHDHFGLVYHADDFEFYPEGTEIKHGDLVWYRDYTIQKSGHLLISESSFTTNYSDAMPFYFERNDNYSGICQRNQAIIYFARKIKSIKRLEPLEHIFCKVTNISGKMVTVKDEDNKKYLLQMPREANGTVGNAIWGYVNERHNQFAAYDTNFPTNSMQIE